MKIQSTWRFSRPFMTSFANEDIRLHIPRSGLIGVQTNKKIHAIDLLQFYQQNYNARIKDLSSLSEVSTQRKMQLIDAIPLEEQNLDIASDDAIKNMQIEYEKQGTTFIMGYPISVQDALKLENYCGGLNLFLNLKFSSDFDNVEVKNKYFIDDEGLVDNPIQYQESLEYLKLDKNSVEQQMDSDDIDELNLSLQQDQQEMNEVSANELLDQTDKKNQIKEEDILNFYDRKGLLIDMNIERDHDLSKVLLQLTEKMVRKFKY